MRKTRLYARLLAGPLLGIGRCEVPSRPIDHRQRSYRFMTKKTMLIAALVMGVVLLFLMGISIGLRI